MDALLQVVDEGLSEYPNDKSLMLDKAGIYYGQDNYPLAIELYFRCWKLTEEDSAEKNYIAYRILGCLKHIVEGVVPEWFDTIKEVYEYLVKINYEFKRSERRLIYRFCTSLTEQDIKAVNSNILNDTECEVICDLNGEPLIGVNQKGKKQLLWLESEMPFEYVDVFEYKRRIEALSEKSKVSVNEDMEYYEAGKVRGYDLALYSSLPLIRYLINEFTTICNEEADDLELYGLDISYNKGIIDSLKECYAIQMECPFQGADATVFFYGGYDDLDYSSIHPLKKKNIKYNITVSRSLEEINNLMQDVSGLCFVFAHSESCADIPNDAEHDKLMDYGVVRLRAHRTRKGATRPAEEVTAELSDLIFANIAKRFRLAASINSIETKSSRD